MSDAVIVAAITSLTSVLLSIVALFKISKTAQAIQEVHLSLNSRLDELVKATRIASHAEGVAEGVAGEKARYSQQNPT